MNKIKNISYDNSVYGRDQELVNYNHAGDPQMFFVKIDCCVLFVTCNYDCL